MDPGFDTCTTESGYWSITTSASSNSQFAGVLAGILIAAISLLFVQDRVNGTRAIGLFAAAMMALSLDSYLFSNITGLQTYDPESCIRSWAQGLAASGVLAVGGVALVAGLASLMALHASRAVNAANKDRSLIVLGGFLVSAIIAAVTLLMVTAYSEYNKYLAAYADFTGNTHLAVALGSVLVLYTSVVIFRRTSRLYEARTMSCEQLTLQDQRLGVSAVAVAGYAIVAALYAGLIGFSPPFAQSEVGNNVLLVISLAIPAVLFGIIAHSVPGA